MNWTFPPDLVEPDNPRIQQSKKLEIDAIELAEGGKLHEAIELFSKSIEAAPERPAPWNNRAQAHRYLGDEKGKLGAPPGGD